ncbi:MAG TPA: hypothetical protein VGB50_03090 [Flavobacterium sp.]|jgi:hypothetical protein
MKKFLILFLTHISLNIFPQEPVMQPAFVNAEKFSADAFAGHDQYGFTYYVSNNAVIKAKGKATWEYKKLALGRVSRVDIQNPLMVVVFYEDFNAVVLLDNQMNEIRQISFSDLENPIIAHAAGIASQNRLWVYNMATQQIGLFDFSTNIFSSLTSYSDGQIIQYETTLLSFYWTDDKMNRYSCDLFGKITNLGKVPSFDGMQVLNGSFLFSENGGLFYFSPKTNTTSAIGIAEKSFRGFHYNHQILSIFTKEGIINYKIELP